ncbi:hypothetical protein [Sphaerisporangium rhizosphaerae]|uniref:Uncharacterized protein n=1 Tax=Sphaerisporangium rhizosphaerae TaxID=2269375 RepID=A0ABW2NYH3_9ACTN
MGAWWIGRWPVVDPDIPDDDKRRIIGNNALADRRVVPSSASGWLGVIAGLLLILVLIAVSQEVAHDRMTLIGGTATLSVLLVGAAAVGLPWGRFAVLGSPTRLVRLYQDRYVVPADLDRSARLLLDRAGHAVETVYASRVNQMGWLDPVANDVVLPRRLWEIARVLRTQSELRAEHARATGGVLTPELRAVLEPQLAALRRSAGEVTGQVAALEAYARRVQAADAALHAEDLLRSNDKYRDLLAHTDDLEGLRDLASRAHGVGAVLASSVREAVAAGRTLAVH